MYGLLSPPGTRRKPSALMAELCNSAKKQNINAIPMTEYKQCDVLVLYGWGGVNQQAAIKAHKGRYVAFDLGYWNRGGFSTRKWRVSINGFHCPERIMLGNPPKRKKDVMVAAPDRMKDGPILLIGNGPKSQNVCAMNWSSEKCAEIRKKFPDREILFRPKPGRPIEKGVNYDKLAGGNLKDELEKAFLVVCRHSNVAVEACIAGVPVACEDGAGAAIYPTLDDWERQPSHAVRQEFLDRLAYWQWSMIEIRQGRFWPWLEKQLEN